MGGCSSVGRAGRLVIGRSLIQIPAPCDPMERDKRLRTMTWRDNNNAKKNNIANLWVQLCKMYTWNSCEVEYVIVNTYLLWRSLKAVGKKEFFSLVLLDLTLLYLWPEGRSVNRSCWGWVEALRMEAALLWTLRCRCSAEKAVESWWSSLQPLTLSAGVCGAQQ